MLCRPSFIAIVGAELDPGQPLEDPTQSRSAATRPCSPTHTQCIILEPLVLAKMRLGILTLALHFLPQAVAFGEEGDKAKAKSLAASAEARKAKAGLRRLKDQIQATMIDLEALKKQLVVSGNYVPAEKQPVSRESLASSPRGVWGRSASHRQQRQRGARGGAAKQLGIADERVPVDVVSGKQAQY
jgi:hypothetical protein